MYAPPLRYKREVLAVHDNPLQTYSSSRELSLSFGKAIQHTVDVGYYAPVARTTLNLAVFIVFLSEIELRLANPRVHTLWARAGAFRHPAVVCSTTTEILQICWACSRQTQVTVIALDFKRIFCTIHISFYKHFSCFHDPESNLNILQFFIIFKILSTANSFHFPKLAFLFGHVRLLCPFSKQKLHE